MRDQQRLSGQRGVCRRPVLHPHADSYADKHPADRRHRDAYTDADADTDTHAHPYQDCHRDPDPDTDAHADAHLHENAHAHRDQHTDANVHRHPHTDRNVHALTDTFYNQQSNLLRDRNDRDTDSLARSHRCADAGRDEHSNTDRIGNRHRCSGRDAIGNAGRTHRDRNSDARIHADANRHSDCDTQSDGDRSPDHNPDTLRHGNGNSHADAFGDANDAANRVAATDAASVIVAVTEPDGYRDGRARASLRRRL